MPAPGELMRNCPYCPATNAPFLAKHSFGTPGSGGETRWWLVASCPVCGGAVNFELQGDNGSILAMHPSPNAGQWFVAELPTSVLPIWSEAGRVFGVGAYPSAVVACGRTLEQAAVEREIEGRTLQQRIEKMRDKGLVTAEFGKAMDYVRLIRNVGAHAGKEVSAESADGTMRFTQQTLRVLFEVPAQLDRLTEHPPELDTDEGDEPAEAE